MRGTSQFTRLSAVIVMTGVILAMGGPNAQAAGIACPPAYAGGVTPSTACHVGGAHNDFLNPPDYQVNLDELFGFDDWLFAGKALEADGGPDIDMGFGMDGNGTSGKWFVDDDAWTASEISHLMLVLKGGNPHQPGGYLAYLIVEGATEGGYVSPFVNLNNPRAGLTGISHITAYVREAEGSVPEPATIGLLALGAGAACRWRRRVRR